MYRLPEQSTRRCQPVVQLGPLVRPAVAAVPTAPLPATV